jgi:hypothetical protein
LSSSEKGKEIKINNLLFELGKLENISVTIEKYINVKEISKVIDKHVKLYNMIKKVDFITYLEHFTKFVKLFETIIEKKITRINFDKKSEIIDFYDEINAHIIKPYFDEFIVTNEYPDYIKFIIYSKILDDFQDKFIDINILIENFNMLLVTQQFKKSIVQSVIEIIIKNRRGCYTIECENIDINIKKKLIELIKECHEISVNNLPQFLRFTLINLYSSNMYKNEDLMKKVMLFKRYGEIPMYSYLINYLTNKIIDISVFIYGLGETDITESTNEDLIELFYIEYEKKYSNNNFVVTRIF